MSLGKRGKTTNNSTEITAALASSEVAAAWGEIPGRVVEFDAEAQTATIKPLYRPIVKGKPLDMPDLLEVPVRFPRAGGLLITMPVRSGDMVTLRPMMRSSESYHTGGAYESPNDTRISSLSDMEAHLDGGEALIDPIKYLSTEAVQIRNEDGNVLIEIDQDGAIQVIAATTTTIKHEDGNYQQLMEPDGRIALTGDAIILEHEEHESAIILRRNGNIDIYNAEIIRLDAEGAHVEIRDTGETEIVAASKISLVTETGGSVQLNETGKVAVTSNGLTLSGPGGELIDLVAQVAEAVASVRVLIASGSSAGTYPNIQAASASALAAQIRALKGGG